MSKTVKLTVALVVVALLALAFGAGFRLGGGVAPSPAEGHEGLAVVEQAWDIILREYVGRDKLDTKTLSQAAIKGMLTSLDDPHTEYLDAEEYRLSMSSLEGEFEGIGAYVAVKDNQITVIAPLPDSPAAKAGIRPGDIILEIDGVPTAGMSLTEVVLKIRGPKGTSIKLRLLHEGESKPEDIEVTRAAVKLPSVRSEMKGNIAYINISQFSENTDRELVPVLENVIGQGAVGMVLDLRQNPGGVLETVIDVTGHFLKQGVVLNVVSQDKKTPISVRPSRLTTDLPMVVLVDDFSASGSEVLAGALQDHRRATIAGTRTYGKGSVNILRQLKDGSGLYITTARWLTPDGRVIEGKGIEPEYQLDLEGDDAIQWAIDFLGKGGK